MIVYSYLPPKFNTFCQPRQLSKKSELFVGRKLDIGGYHDYIFATWWADPKPWTVTPKKLTVKLSENQPSQVLSSPVRLRNPPKWKLSCYDCDSSWN